MAHLIEENQITGKSEIAFVGKKPWHGLGQELTKDAPIEVWRTEAGLAWEAQTAPVVYLTPTSNSAAEAREFKGKNVLYRSDTGASLGVVSDRYKPHQPDEILQFFDTLVRSAGFSLEVAGAIKGGKRIWALANTNREACVFGDDVVKGYLLLSTSFDGTTATVGQFTSIRVVCNNTLSMADSENAPSRVSLRHGSNFNASMMRNRLGLVVSGFDGMMDKYRYLANANVNSAYVNNFLIKLFPPVVHMDDAAKTVLVHSRGYGKVMDLFEGKGMGANLAGTRGTKWGLLNAVSQWVDHERGHNADTRLTNAWFGEGNRLKAEAENILLV